MKSTPAFHNLSDTVSLRLQHRLIAVWALAEGVLGGILHALHLPLTGLIVGSIAVCCLTLLARFRRRRGDLLKATILVLLVKAMLSPHTPAAAYIAVLSQGLLAEAFFLSISNFKLRCILLGLFTQLLSAILHIGKLVLLFGMDLWEALDNYMAKLAQILNLENDSLTIYLAAIYLGVHALAGIFMGSIAAGLPKRLSAKTESPLLAKPISLEAISPALQPDSEKKKFRLQLSLVLIWLVLFAVFLQSYFGIGPEILPQNKILQILVRSVLILSAWNFVVSPLLLRIMKKWLAGKKSELNTELQTIIQLLPETGALIQKSWQQCAGITGIKKIRLFLKTAFRHLFVLPAE